MAASLEIGNGWQSPRISFTCDFSQTETERNTIDWQSPRISFSLNLSQTDRISPEKRKRKDVADINCVTDFEFYVNGRNSITGETHLAIADELFMDGKMVPLIHGPVEAQPVPIAHHVSLENLRCLSPVRLTSSPSKITSSCWGNVASKSLRHKPPSKWKEMLFKLSNKENVCAENRRRTLFKVVDQSQPSSTKSVWSFSRSCRTGGEMKGNGLFRSLPFSRSHSTAERKYKAATSGCTSKEIEIDLSGLVEGSKPPEAWSRSNKVQPEPQYYSELKPRSEAEEGKGEARAEQYTAGRGKLGSSGLPASRMSSQRSTGRVGANGRLMIRNLDSPPPGKPMAEGSLVVKANNSMGGGVRVSPVLNVGGSWNGCGGLFGFFSRREKKQPQPSAYPRTNRMKGT